jgi:uncharacterized membrane protein (UPF0136 family)
MLEQSTTTEKSINSVIEEKTIEICLHKGLLQGTKYYWDQKHQQTGIKYSLRLAKANVEALLASRGLINAVRKPKSQGWVIVAIILVSIAVAIYFYFRAQH